VALSLLTVVMPDAPETFTCPECGALYEVTRTKFPEPVEDCAECVECGCVMAEWNTSSVPLYRLIRTPGGRTPPEKPMA
jgi:transcription elongation factor Elf1